jgi:hypothetical protein
MTASSSKGRRARFQGKAAIFTAILAFILILGCSNPANTTATTPAYATCLYMVDGNNGHVWTFDPSTHTCSSSSLVTTASGKAAGEIQFYKGIGYVAMGNGGGVYYFDPSASAPMATQLAGTASLNAQYFAFYSATKAYFTTCSYPSTGAVYSFNPSNPAAGVSQVDSADITNYMQAIVVGPDNYVYGAENNTGKVLRINPSTDQVAETYTASAGGTTGLLAGTYKGKAGVYVANNGGYDASYNPLPGTIDFIDTSVATPTLTTVVATTAALCPGRLLQLGSTRLLSVGSASIDLVDLGGTSASATNIATISGGYYGVSSIAMKDSLVYVPANKYSTTAPANRLYVIDASGTQRSYSPVTTIMSGTDNLANIAFYQD